MATLLIIEGDATVARLFANVLEQEQWKTDVRNDGNSAMRELAGDKHYDAILVSFKLAGVDGVELVTFIRSLEHRKHVPVIMITGTPGLETSALAAGADEVLQKPLDMRTLVSVVVTHLKKAAEHAHSSQGSPQRDPSGS